MDIVVTNAGRAALINAPNTGTTAVIISHVGFSNSAIVPTPAMTALAGEFKRIAGVPGEVVADDIIHVNATDASADAYELRSFALYLSDGTLFALYGQAAPILEKTASSIAALSIDAVFADINAAQITFGATNFTNPPATTERQGVIEIATVAEAQAGIDALRALTPANAKAAILGWLLALDGAGSGLDADLLDGQHGSWYADIISRLGYTPWGPNNDGAGSGLDAGLFAGQLPSYYTNVIARLGYTPANRAGDTFTGPVSISGSVGKFELASTASGRKAWFAMQEDGNFVNYLTVGGTDKALWGCNSLNGPIGFNLPVTVNGGTVMHTNNDGSGSGYDSDLLDGQHGSWYANIPGRLGYAPVNRAGDKLTGGLEMPYLSVTANGSGDNIRVGDDAFIGDSNLPNGITIRGVQDFNAGFVRFGNSPHALGCNPNDGTLRYGPNWHVLASIAESMSQNGYMRLSNNLMMVWGRWASSSQPGSPVNISFPASFSSEPYALMLLPVVTAASTISVWSSDGITGSSFPGRCSQASIGCRFFAIGPT